MDRRDLLSGIFWLGIAILVLISSVRLGVGSFNAPGPGFLLFWSALLFGLLSSLLLTKAVLKKDSSITILALWKGGALGIVVITAASLIIYVLVLTRIGFVVATLGLMIVLFALARMKPWVIIIAAALAVGLSHLIFHIFLRVPLPSGILGFIY